MTNCKYLPDEASSVFLTNHFLHVTTDAFLTFTFKLLTTFYMEVYNLRGVRIGVMWLRILRRISVRGLFGSVLI